VLISDAVRQQLDANRIIVRRLGEFRVAGKTHSVIIHELLCRCDAEKGEKRWIDVFENGLDRFREGAWDAARAEMNRTREIRGGADGPSEFYLRKIAALQTNGQVDNWTGIVELSEK